MKRFFNLSTIIVTAVLVAGTVFFLWVGSYAAAIMALLALYWAWMTRRSELMVADGLDQLETYRKMTGDLTSHRDELLAENEALRGKVTQLLEENKALGEKVAWLLKATGDTKEKEPVQTVKPQSRKRPRSKRPIQDIKESLKEISPKKEAE